jgi:ATP-binding cassette subfamily B protein
MWRMIRLGYRHEPQLLVSSVVLTLLAALPDALLALWLKFLADGVIDGDRTLVVVAALGLGVSTTLTWVLRVVSDRVSRRFRDRITIALESHVAELQATVATIAHQERPEHLDRLAVLRTQVFVLDHMFMSVFTTIGWVLRLAVTLVLLASVSPVLLLLAVFALPTVATSSWRPGVERAAEERGASHERLAAHLFQTGTTAPPGKEVRLDDLGPRLVAERRAAWGRWYGPVAAARWKSAVWHTLAWTVFGLSYVGAIVYVSSVLDAGAGDVLLVLAAGSRLSAYIGATAGEIGFLRGVWLDGSRRLAWLEDYAAAVASRADQEVPDRLTDGIALDHVTFAYPGTDRRVLDDVSVHLPAGSVIAIVGENGAGKSTLVKLLSKMYEPDAGSITVDGVPLTGMPADEWRERMAGAFQDFFRFELPAVHSVGVGDAERWEDRDAVGSAVDRAGAADVVSGLREGLDTQLGVSWPGGVEVSFGQWQKLALARGFMRERPLLLVLDEPTAALDAETEHALFERYAEAAQEAAGRDDGRITILVSHRFSTVRMADLIVVMDGAKVVEVGDHDTLIAAGGTYAELYGIQATSYR